MKNVMVDLETLDTAPTSAIISIGAVMFDENNVDTDNTFYRTIFQESSISAGLTFSQATLDWWKNQTEEAQTVLTCPNRVSLDQALCEFYRWLPYNVKLWGNGAAFDNAILSNAYRAVSMEQPWKFWNDRCYRTVSILIPEKREQQGTHHNALDDAKSQAFHLVNYGSGFIKD